MPANSRFHVINQYNNGACDIVIASDAVHAFGSDAVQLKEVRNCGFAASFRYYSEVYLSLLFETKKQVFLAELTSTKWVTL